MLKLVQAAPEQRLPNLLQDPIRYGYPHMMVNLPRYFCPHCGEYTVFSVTKPEPSPFPDAVQQQFDRLTNRRPGYEQGISDFLCRVCSRPVRVVFRIHEFHMASNHYFAESVVETAV